MERVEILSDRKVSRQEFTKRRSKKNSDNDGEVERKHIEDLMRKLPQLAAIFDLHKKIGEGTFSSVFLGTLKCHQHLEENKREMFAVKHLVPTSHPSRIKQELKCLRDIGGKDNIIGVDLCLRHFDTIVFIMPYIPHRKFTEYVLDMNTLETKKYFRALFIALRRVHQFGIIHRDVKPSNFLYDRENQRYQLVDFGLAQSVSELVDRQKCTNDKCLEVDIKCPSVCNNNGSCHSNSFNSSREIKRKRPSNVKDEPHAKKFAIDPLITAGPFTAGTKLTTKCHLTSDRLKLMTARRRIFQEKAESYAMKNIDSLSPNQSALTPVPNTNATSNENIQEKPIDYSLKRVEPSLDTSSSRNRSKTWLHNGSKNSHNDLCNSTRKSCLNKCDCFGKPSVCEACLSRPSNRAPRAGTQGFRPPEVLLKYQNQTTAVDMWASGVILLSVLSGRYPFFKAPDDATALAEFMTLFGSSRIRDVAIILGQHISYSEERSTMDLRLVCRRMRTQAMLRANPTKYNDTSPCLQCFQSYSNCTCFKLDNFKNTQREWCGFPETAFNLLERLLDLNPHTRITAEEALRHPFVSEEYSIHTL